ncbi:MAG: HD domain-containing protein [Clostridia bacterium]
MENNSKVNNIVHWVKESMGDSFETHNYQHAYRVKERAEEIIQKEEFQKIDKEVIQTACLVHEMIDHKFFNEEMVTKQKEKIKFKLKELQYSNEQVEHILYIIENMSYSTGRIPETIEGKIVQDADRLDALLAFGVVRPFTYSAKKDRKMYDDENSALSHYIEKKLKLEKLLNTKGAKEIAKEKAEITYLYLAYLLDELPEDIYEKHHYEKEIGQFYKEYRTLIPTKLIPLKYKEELEKK